MITNDARRTREIKSGIATAKAVFSKKNLSTRKFDLNFMKKPVKYYIWSVIS
jgi:hypothetical protein